MTRLFSFVCTLFLWSVCFFSCGGVSSLYAQTSSLVLQLSIRGPILGGTGEYLKEGIHQAKKEGAAAILVTIDTPGGILSITQDIVQEFFASEIPVIVYVTPTGGTATSAGVFITLAAHLAYMAPGSTIGAAHPVTGGGGSLEGDMRTKAENATVSLIRSIAEQRGKNVAWAEKAVRESVSLTAREALEQKVIDGVADTKEALFEQLNGREVKVGTKIIKLSLQQAKVQEYEPSFRQRYLNLISDPTVVGILWLLAITGITAELYHPGLIFPGVIGAVCLILSLSAYQVLPMNDAGLVFIILGAVLLGAEIFVPSGLLGIGGAVCLLLGLFNLVDPEKAPNLGIESSIVLPLFGVLLFGMGIIVSKVAKVRKQPLLHGYAGMIGLPGEVLSDEGSMLMVRVQGEIWRAQANGEGIEKGSAVKVIGTSEGVLIVTKG